MPAASQVAIAKFWAGSGGQRVVHTAQHLHGGMGVDRDYPLHRYFLYAKQLELTLGGTTSQLRKLGRADRRRSRRRGTRARVSETVLTGGLHHVDLTVADFRRSKEFYASVLPLMGFTRLPKEFGAVAWQGQTIIAIQPAKPEEKDRAHSRYAPGLHHLGIPRPIAGRGRRLSTPSSSRSA